MKRQVFVLFTVLLTVLSSLGASTPSYSQSVTQAGTEKLKDAAGGALEITLNPLTNTPSFIRGQIPLSLQNAGPASKLGIPQATVDFVDRYRDVFGITDSASELTVQASSIDELGMMHVTLGQRFQGVEVYNSVIKLHLAADGQMVLALSNGFVPGIQLADVQPIVTANQAIEIAHTALPSGVLLAEPRLVLYPGQAGAPGPAARLAWLVELRDDGVPARNIYVVDAKQEQILKVQDRLYRDALDQQGTQNHPFAVALVALQRNRETYDAKHGTTLPGTLVRSESQPAIGDTDVDNAHDFAGATYDYFLNAYQRDSYDNSGATIVSTAHYSQNYNNAFWNGEQMVYGDGFAVEDVVAHELTHAVTERTANLEYKWQAGALNESFSDVFASMVDRDDWLIGEDLPPDVLGGRDAIRDMADPARFGQPAHVNNWVSTCSDNEGVHTNSGITNKAFYNVATNSAAGKAKAERIFYRALVIHLQQTSSLEDARAAALQAAQDLHPSDTTVQNAVRDGFDAVGLNGQWQPPANDCSCAANAALADQSAYPDRVSALQVAVTLYRVRDQLLSNDPAAEYWRDLYEAHTGRASSLFVFDPALRVAGGSILAEFAPGLDRLLNGAGDQAIVTQAMIDDLTAFLRQMAEEDREQGGGQLATAIDREMLRVNLPSLIGLTFDQAWAKVLRARRDRIVYLPLLLR